MPATEGRAAPDWRPGAALEHVRLRATLAARVRDFFSTRGVMEVDTPLLGRGATTDPAIESFATHYRGPGAREAQTLYLQTSPEFFMKRLLAAGSGAIFQLAHAFRNGEAGRRHNPEFLLLEWYRPGFTPQALMAEIDALLVAVLRGYRDYQPARRIRYRQWFLDQTGLDPWCDPVAAFRAFALANLPSVPPTLPADELDPWLYLLLTHWLEPRLGEGAVFVHDYPVSQASLASVHPGPPPVARRFELYLDGVELANGYHELGDAEEQRRRFSADNARRRAAGQAPLPPDQRLLAALAHGLPDCSGVALGFDRLVMLAAGLDGLDTASGFSWPRI